MLKPGRARRAFAAAFLAAVTGSGILAAGAFAVAQPIVAADDFYGAATYTMDQGDRPELQNIGANSHDATSRANGPDANFLFESPTIGSGSTTLDGTQYLTTGTYAFFCTTHPLSMSGNLQVSALGAPQARPKIDVTAANGKIAKVSKKGKLPVTVKALTKSDHVTLTLKLGKATVGTQSEFNLAAGQQKKLSVKLTKSGKSKLSKKSKATVKVIGSVRFGSPDNAKSTLK
jgi:plastocyanin